MSERQENKPVYRQPVLPQDHGKQCEFSDYGGLWMTGTLIGYAGIEDCRWQVYSLERIGEARMARIRVE